MDDNTWLSRTVALAVDNVAAGGGPFGAIVVRAGVEVASGTNRVTRDLDPTAHAEVVAIRTACATLGDFSLDDCTLYSSCEPCPMCMSAALWSRLNRVVYAADRDEAARGGFDDRTFYDLLATDRAGWPMSVSTAILEERFLPFQAWLELEEKKAY